MKHKHLLKMLIAFLYLAFTANSLIAETTATAPAIVDGKYQISNLAELRWVSENSSSWDKDFIITADIDATDTATWNGGLGFTPIGIIYPGIEFTGNFTNAGNYVIDSLTVNRPQENYIGLFGSIKSVTLESIYLTNISITGSGHVGSLVGYVDSSSVTSCYATGSVAGNNGVGGLVGYSDETSITNSYASSSVSGNIKVGGLVGTSSASSPDSVASIRSSYASGSVSGNIKVGGLVGFISLPIG